MLFYYLTILLMPFGNHPVLSMNYHGITPIKVAGFFAVIWGFIEVVGGKSSGGVLFSRQGRRFVIFGGIFICSAIVNRMNFSSDSGLRFTSMVFFFLSTCVLINSKDRLMRTLFLLVVSTDLAALYMFREYSLYGGLYENFRPGGILNDPNYSALNILVVLPLIWAFFVGASSRKMRAFSLASGALCLGALILSQSRGALIGVAVVSFAVLVGRRFSLKTMLSFGLLLVIIFVAIPERMMNRVAGSSYDSSISQASRIQLIYAGVAMVKKNPWFGVGPGNFKWESDRYNPQVAKQQIAHNSYLSVAAELGLPGLLALLWVWFHALRDSRRFTGSLPKEEIAVRRALTMLRLGFIGYLATAVFLTAEYEKIVWLLVFLFIAVSQPVFALAVAAEHERPPVPA